MRSGTAGVNCAAGELHGELLIVATQTKRDLAGDQRLLEQILLAEQHLQNATRRAVLTSTDQAHILCADDAHGIRIEVDVHIGKRPRLPAPCGKNAERVAAERARRAFDEARQVRSARFTAVDQLFRHQIAPGSSPHASGSGPL